MTKEKKDELIDLCREIDSYSFDSSLVKVERLSDFILEEIYEKNRKLEKKICLLNQNIESKNELIKEYRECYELKKNAMQLMKESYEDMIKEERKKARSVVAMLFWEWKSYMRMADEVENEDTYECRKYIIKARSVHYSFKKAYAMIKDNQ